jgi:catechol 2,3-dioxygenase-like lactoylglutathione lyase family enzyme
VNLGAFSISLTVKDLATSQAFYEHLGFSLFAGNPDHKYVILKNGDAIVGLFEGMFEKNMLTFNPGWDAECNTLEGFEDVRAIQARLKSAGIVLSTETDPDGTGPGHIALEDPDGNPILIDQHV